MTNDMTSDNATLELGALDEPVLVFGGPYSNLQATEALLNAAQQHDIAPDHIICTGDVVAYCANPVETIAVIRSSGIHVVMGNCEESLGFRLDDCGCGFEEDTACDILSRQWYAYSDALLSDDDRHWLRTRPRRITGALAGRSVSLIHGSVTDISGWVFHSTDAKQKTADLDSLGSDAVIGGHCGLPFAHMLPDDRLWLNAGVIGMPANDGTQRGWYAILTPEDDAVTINLKPLAFDAASAANAMRQTKLAEAYATALETGLWPNMDVLPEAESRQKGEKLDEIELTWRRRSRNAA